VATKKKAKACRFNGHSGLRREGSKTIAYSRFRGGYEKGKNAVQTAYQKGEMQKRKQKLRTFIRKRGKSGLLNSPLEVREGSRKERDVNDERNTQSY